MTINVYIDNNVWDFLFDLKIDLSVELPRNEFCLCLTREAEFEIPPIPPDKTLLKEFIKETRKKCAVDTRSYFGFYDKTHSSTEQRVAGFNKGHFASEEELSFIEQQKTRLGQDKKLTTKLYKNEADIAIGARSFHSVVITLDIKKGRSSPIIDAYKKGGHVVFLNEFKGSGLSLKEFIRQNIRSV